MPAPIIAIVNPRSGGGRTGRLWPKIARKLERSLGPFETRFTDHTASPHDLPAEAPTRAALKDGARLIIAVGGDGTINEVVNGFFEHGTAIAPTAQLGLLNGGTGGDFRRSFGLPDRWDDSIDRLAQGSPQPLDIGRIRFTAHDGRETTRYFNNIASFGMSGAVDQAVNRTRWPKFFGGSFAFLWASLTTALRYRPQAVRLKTDTGFDETIHVGTAAIANGRYFGGGMRIAPHAKPDDGVFEIIIMRDTTLKDLITNAAALYNGSHLQNEKVLAIRARMLEAHPADPKACVLLDIDGEAPGRLPAYIDILPGALKLRC